MNYMTEIILALSKIDELEKQRKLTPPENLQRKLYYACLNSLNNQIQLCKTLVSLIQTGMHNPTFTQMGEFNLAEYYQTHGYLSNNTSLTGLPLSPPEVLFTDPNQQEYCVQSLYRDLLIPEPRPVHDYPQNNIWELLKFRLEADTFICSVNFPDYFKPSDIAYRMGGLLTGNPKVKNNIAYKPLYGIFNSIFKTILELSQTFNLSLSAAGKEIHDYKFLNTSMNNISETIVQRYLHNISDVYVLMGTEPRRLGWADTLDGIKPIEKLWAVSRTSLCEIRFILDVLKKITSANYFKLSLENDNSFDAMKTNDVKTLAFLMEAAANNATEALNWFNTCSFEPSTFAEDLESVVVSGEFSPVEKAPLSLNLVSYRDRVASQVSIATKNLHRDNKIENYFIYKPQQTQNINLVESAKVSINAAGHLSFMIGCNYAYLILGRSGEYKISLGKIERPTVRAIMEVRRSHYVYSIINKIFEGDVSDLFWFNQTDILPQNSLELLLQSSNLDPIMYLDLYDNCERLSPLSLFYQPQNPATYSVSFGHNIIKIHETIFQSCTPQNAPLLMNAFNSRYDIQFTGSEDLFNRCSRLAADSMRGRFHNLLSDYMPDSFHELEHEFEDSIVHPSVLPVMAVTFCVSLLLFLFCTRFHKKSLFTSEEQRARRAPEKEFKPTPIVAGDRYPRRLFTNQIPTVSEEKKRLHAFRRSQRI